jgi:hypothetical protein
MTRYIDPRPGWVRQRTYELQQPGLSYAAARREQAEAEFGSEENGPAPQAARPRSILRGLVGRSSICSCQCRSPLRTPYVKLSDPLRL